MVLAFLVAPGVGCLALDLIAAIADRMSASPSFDVAAVVFVPLGLAFGAYPIALVFGVPAYLLVRDFRVDLMGSASVGALVATAPFLLAFIVWGFSPRDQATELAFIAAVGASGAVAGVAFWAMTFRRLPRRPRVAKVPASTTSPESASPQHRSVEPHAAEPWRLTS